ncbi:hypothetical protein, partial [Zobellia laminariae]
MAHHKRRIWSVYKLFLFSILGFLILSCNSKDSKKQLFKLVSSKDSSIDFQNTLSENDSVN